MVRTARIALTLVVALLITCPAPAAGKKCRPKKPFGLDKVVAFTYLDSKKCDPKKLRSVTFFEPVGPKGWRDFAPRGVVTAVGHTWFDLLRNPSDKAVGILVGADYGGNPKPAVSIDEFGFDYGGQTDEKAAAILRETKRRRPELALCVWEMRGPIPKVLGDAYRDVAELVTLESYVGSKSEYWWIAAQVHSARIHGILPKTIAALGIGKGGNPGENWATTKEEVEQQVRFVRLIAPESPGIGFYAGGDFPELIAKADEMAGRYFSLPTDGSGLPADVAAIARLFSDRHEKPTLVCAPEWVEPNRSTDDPGKLVKPNTMRAYVLNLGESDATNVKIRLRDAQDKGGQVFAQGIVSVIPKHGETTAVLPVKQEWKSWKTWQIEVQSPNSEVIVYKR